MSLDPLMTITVVLALISISAVVYYFALTRKEDEKGAMDMWVINPMTQYTKNKSAIGKLKGKIHEKDGWSAVEFLPRGSNIKRLEKEGKKIESEVIFLPSNNLEWINKGAWDRDSGFLILNPINDKLPEALKHTSFGIGSRLKSAEKEVERFEERVRVVRDKNIEDMTMDVKGLNFVKAREALMREGIENKGTGEPVPKK